MTGNSFGEIFKITTFGESHGRALGCVIDGCPSGFEICENDIQTELDKRKPGQSGITTPRNEKDKVEILSGIFEGKTTGTPISLLVWNEDYKSGDYDEMKDVFRPSHTDFTYQMKYGIRDYRGGGRSSARETLARVAGGAIAKKYLKEKFGVEIMAYTSEIYGIKCGLKSEEITQKMIDENITRCPDKQANKAIIEVLEKMIESGNSVGGAVKCVVRNCPVGLGEPVFDKLSARLAYAMMGINAVKGFEIGDGIESSRSTGEENNDEFYVENGAIMTKTNHAGGILGGISNGQDIDFTTYFKPIATIKREQNTINKNFENVKLQITKGRHDCCCVPRAVPVVEAMTALVLMDFVLLNKRFEG